jgi:raffinose/stachyose/melibiose transport system substrate-binding protein
MFKKKFFVAMIIVLAVSLIVFVGCTAAKKQVTISFWHLDTQDSQKALWQKIADDFTAKNPNVKVEITVLENQAFKDKIATVMQSGNPPDVFRSWGGGVMNAYAKAGLLKDVTKDLAGTEWGNSIAPGALGVYAYEGKNYGVPYTMGAVGLWYNKEIFEKLGIKPFETWDDLIAGVKKIKAAGITPIALGEGDKWPGHFWWVYLATRIGGKAAFDKATTRQGSFTDEPYVKAGELLKQLVDLKPFQTGFLSAPFNDEGALVGNGKAAMELMGQWAPSNQTANSADGKGLGDKLGYMSFPAVAGGAGELTDVMGGGDGLAFGKNASPEAIEFVKFMMQMDNYSQLVAPLNFAPCVKGGEKFVTDKNILMVIDQVAKAKYYQLYYDQYMDPAVGEVIKDQTQGIFAGKVSPIDCAKAIDASYTESLK